MATTKTTFTYNPGGLGNVTCYLHTSYDYLNVYATVEFGDYLAFYIYSYCKLTLQRTVGETWQNVETVKGYCESGKNLNVTFSNIAKKGEGMRVILDIYVDSKYTDFIKTVGSNVWIR